MNDMFLDCLSLKFLDLSSFNTTNVKNMNNMFVKCFSLKSLDLSSFNTTNVKYMNDMFFDTLYLRKNMTKCKDNKLLNIINECFID